MEPFVAARQDLPDALSGGAVVVGNFDGLHRGHQALVATAIDRAGARGGPAVALTFDPHPRAWFGRNGTFFDLSPLEVKQTLMRAAGLNGVLVEDFNGDFAAQSAETFFRDVLVAQFNPHTIVVGHDFRFGKGRVGDETLLRKMADQTGIEVAVVEPQKAGQTVYSSSAVRAALSEGECDRAAELLGYRWFIRADVRHGEKRGRNLGYPTANMSPVEGCGLRHGVYAVLGRVGDDVIAGVANFGKRPQFEIEAPLLETFFFDFEGDLYGQTLDVAPIAFLRGEAKFDGIDQLVAQMHDDSRQARDILKSVLQGDPVASLPLAMGLTRLGAGAHGAVRVGAPSA